MAGLTQYDPFSDLTNMHSQIDQLFSNLLGGNTNRLNAPALDVYSDDKNLVAELNVPGFDKEDIDVNVHDNVLEISGQKHEKEESKGKKRNYLVRESYSNFYRSLALPKRADGNNVKAAFDNGVLKVTIPLKELPKPKKVAISAGKK